MYVHILITNKLSNGVQTVVQVVPILYTHIENFLVDYKGYQLSWLNYTSLAFFPSQLLQQQFLSKHRQGFYLFFYRFK